MSSLTKDEFLLELKARSVMLANFTDDQLGSLVDIALRAYSGRLPKVKISVDNAVVSGQELYDYPSGALKVTKIRDSDSYSEVLFSTEDQSNGSKIRLGSILQRSYEDLLQKEFYSNPLSQESVVSVSYSAFDIEYVVLQTVPGVSDRGLEAVSFYVEYLALNQRAAQAAENAHTDITEVPANLVDRSSDGASTTVSFITKSDVSKRFAELATIALNKFTEMTQATYGTRG